MEGFLRLLPGPQPLLIRYSATIAMVLLSFAIKLGMQDRTGIYGFILYIPAVVAAAVIFDRGSGYLAVAASVACVASYIPWATQTLEPHVSAIATFVLVGTSLVFVGEGLRRALERAEAASRERDILLEEMSHRVKNKFAMIHSIIELQARASPPEFRDRFDAIASRVKVIASVHDSLQRSRHGDAMNMAEYLPRLCTSLSEVLGHLRPIALTVSADKVTLPPRKALPTGLIVNELVTNAYKYAFPEDRTGHIVVEFRARTGKLELIVSDDGIGCPERPPSGLGSKLVSVLAGQLGGDVQRETLSPGCRVTIRFEN
ncbi:MAG TPA: sensor histidine kinase [Fimbriimonas sp.]|nr:sensor histidine kinase [Fimbriimonas sp.]